MAASRAYKACGQPVLTGSGRTRFDGSCAYPRAVGKTKCIWHWLLKQPAERQRLHAERRLAAYREGGFPDRPTRPKEEWPPGERWCSGCQDYVPLFYCSGSRCKSCTSTAGHRAMVAKTYGLESGEYDALFAMQGGRCFICQRKSPSRRLAVDHDHGSGAVRGLLCPDPDRGCNHKVLGPLEANSVDGGLAAARRMVAYLEDPPYAELQRRLRLGATPESVARTYRSVAALRAAKQASSGTSGDPAPF